MRNKEKIEMESYHKKTNKLFGYNTRKQNKYGLLNKRLKGRNLKELNYKMCQY